MCWAVKLSPASDGTVPAVPENKRDAIRFVNGFRAGGVANPVDGFKTAFAAGPHIVYFVTDGDVRGRGAVVDGLRAMNKEKSVKVILFRARKKLGEMLTKRGLAPS